MSKMYRVSIDGKDGRMDFWPCSPNITLEEVYSRCSVSFAALPPSRWLESETVDIQSADAREDLPFWVLHRRLKGHNAGSFADVVRDSPGLPRPYEYDPDAVVAMQNPQPMQLDPVLQSIGRSTAANCLRGMAAEKRRQAENFDRLASVAEQLTPGSPEELALWDLINGVR